MICIEACPFDAMIFDRDTAKALKCDECAGAFRCVPVCPAKVLVVEE
jgi:Fe-S-cluster-containing hydrogenase component 2